MEVDKMWKDMYADDYEFGMDVRYYMGDKTWLHPCGLIYDENDNDDDDTEICECKVCIGVQTKAFGKPIYGNCHCSSCCGEMNLDVECETEKQKLRHWLNFVEGCQGLMLCDSTKELMIAFALSALSLHGKIPEQEECDHWQKIEALSKFREDSKKSDFIVGNRLDESQ